MAEQELNALASPKLDDEQIARIEGCSAASRKTYRAGEALLRTGDHDFHFFVVKSGEIEIIDGSG